MFETPRQVVSTSEADLDFSHLAALAEANGSVMIYKDNKPKFKLIDLEQDNDLELTDDEKIDIVAARILKKYRRAFEELAK